MDVLKDIYEFITTNRFTVGGLTILIAFLLDMVISKKVLVLVQRAMLKSKRLEDGQVKTFILVLRSVILIVICYIAGMNLLQTTFHINTSSLIATTGVLGLVLSLGAQNLIKDAISGMFLFIEKQYAVGDLVTIDSFVGTVQAMTFRVTTLKSIHGDLMTIPNGNITKVINHAREEIGVVLDIPISYQSNSTTTAKLLRKTMKIAADELDALTKEPSVLGIEEMKSDCYMMRILVSCKNGTQFDTKRAILARITQTFQKHNIHTGLIRTTEEEKNGASTEISRTNEDNAKGGI